jgi:hypothetical protein
VRWRPWCWGQPEDEPVGEVAEDGGGGEPEEIPAALSRGAPSALKAAMLSAVRRARWPLTRCGPGDAIGGEQVVILAERPVHDGDAGQRRPGPYDYHPGYAPSSASAPQTARPDTRD